MPENEIRYTETYEYISVRGKIGTVGISKEASDKLGDIYLIELPEDGREYMKAEEIGVIESVKTAADVYCPISGKVVKVNPRLEKEPELVSKDPTGEGWLFKLEINDTKELNNLMDEKQFKKHINEVGRW